MRKCMFCSQKADTKEDVWPLWLMKRFPGKSNSCIYAERGGGQLNNWMTAKPKLQVKRLCHSCNHGWMSSLENKVMPLIESILDNKLLELDIATQRTLSHWAVKTAMVIEAVDPNRVWFYSENDRQQLRESLTLPSRTSVWLAKCVNQPNVYSAAKDHGTTINDGGIRAFVSTLAFGSLAIQVVSLKVPSEIPDSTNVSYDFSEGPWDSTLVKIWPTSRGPLTWPPRRGLDGDLGLEALTERLSAKKRWSVADY